MLKTVIWGKHYGNWGLFRDYENFQIAENNLAGVYVIWRDILEPFVIYVGETDDIKRRLGEHQLNEKILEYEEPKKPLYVTWTPEGDKHERLGIESFFYYYYQEPPANEKAPDENHQIEVNPPFS